MIKQAMKMSHCQRKLEADLEAHGKMQAESMGL